MIGVTITIPGDPGGAAINQARRARVIKSGKHKGKPGTRKSTRCKKWIDKAVPVIARAWSGELCLSGSVQLEVITYWPRVRRKGPAKGRPLGDVDATVKTVLDALVDGGVMYNDGQAWRVILESHYDKANPRIEVRL